MTDLYNPFIKTVALNDLPESAWRYILGGDGGAAEIKELYQSIPWLFRGVDIRANAVASMPFSIYRGETEIDNSDDYKNAVKVLPNPGALFGLVEAALTIWGYAYAFKTRSAYTVKGVRYLLPTSIDYKIDGNGIPTFTRMVNGQPQTYTVDDIIYWWKSDPFVEIGAPMSSPALAAASAAGVLLNVDKFAAAFFERGAIKATLLTTKNILPSERDRLKSWWKRMFGKGTDSAWQTDIINADVVTPIVVGEGIESLENETLTQSKRVDIAAAMGIPYSVLFSNASNRATAEQDDLHLYTKTIIPECGFIQSVINEQLFGKMGYKLVFTPENMDIFQEDENERAASLEKLIAALDKPEEFLLAAEILGFEIAPDIENRIRAMIAEKNARREAMEQVAAQAPEPEDEPQQEEEAQPEPPNMRALDLDRWRTKALKRLKSGRPAACQFTSDVLDPLTVAAIGASLEGAQSETEIKAIFDNVWIGYP